MRFGSLFAGIGGLDLGMERAGMTCAWQVERDEFCQRVLAKHWPEVPRYGDIETFFPADAGPVEVVVGGFPCQPHSVVGARRGVGDDRHLWPEFARVIRGARPRWVVLENVPGLLNSSGGRAFGGVLGDLAEAGYDAAWGVIPAASVGAHHRRDRVFAIAYAVGARSEGGFQRPRLVGQPDGSHQAAPLDLAVAYIRTAPHSRAEVGRAVHGFPSRLDGDLMLGGVPALSHAVRGENRNKRIKALGNAVVPQVAEIVGRAIMEAEAEDEHD